MCYDSRELTAMPPEVSYLAVDRIVYSFPERGGMDTVFYFEALITMMVAADMERVAKE
jgi:hypothetical protein